jgi:hypothetical protein
MLTPREGWVKKELVTPTAPQRYGFVKVRLSRIPSSLKEYHGETGRVELL